MPRAARLGRTASILTCRVSLLETWVSQAVRCDARLATSASQLATCASQRETCVSQLETCVSQLETCVSQLETCVSQLEPGDTPEPSLDAVRAVRDLGKRP